MRRRRHLPHFKHQTKVDQRALQGVLYNAYPQTRLIDLARQLVERSGEVYG